MIKNKADALKFVQSYSEFEMYDFFNGSIWFRYDGPGAYGKEYTINHEEKGIIGATILETVSYVWRNRKEINEWLKNNEARMVNAKAR